MKTTEMCLQQDIKQPPRLFTSRTVLLDLCVVLKRSYGELVWQTPPIQLKSVLKGKKSHSFIAICGSIKFLYILCDT